MPSSAPIEEFSDEIERLVEQCQREMPPLSQTLETWAKFSPVEVKGADKQVIAVDIRQLLINGLDPDFRHKHAALDVGAGNGLFMEVLAEGNFRQIAGLDITGDHFNGIARRLAPIQPTLIQGRMEDLERLLGEKGLRGRIGALLNSHNLYYLEYDEGGEQDAQEILESNLRQTGAVLAPGGRALTVLKHPREGGTSKILYEGMHDQPFSLDLQAATERVSHESDGELEAEVMIREVKTRCKTLEEALDIALLVLLDGRTIPGVIDIPKRFDFQERIREVLSHVITHFWDAEKGEFVFDQTQIHAIMEKAA